MAVYPQEWRGIFPVMHYHQVPTYPHLTQLPVYNGLTGLPAYCSDLQNSNVTSGISYKPVYIMFSQTPSGQPTLSTHALPASSRTPMLPTPMLEASSYIPTVSAPTSAHAHLQMTPPVQKPASSVASGCLAPLPALYGQASRSVSSNMNGCHRVVIQGSKLNYLGQNSSVQPAYTPSTSPPLVKKVLFTSDNFTQAPIKYDSTYFLSESATSQTSLQRAQLAEMCPAENPVNFSNLDLLSTVSLSQTNTGVQQNLSKTMPFKVPVSGNSGPGNGQYTNDSDNSHTQTRDFMSETEAPNISSLPHNHALALDLVPAKMLRKSTVWLNVTLQVDTSGEIKRGQQGVQYRSLITNIVTELFYPPQLCPPDDVVPDVITATASYDDRGRLTVLQVEFITAGIYKVDTDNDTNKKPSVGKSSSRSVTLVRMESLEILDAKSQYLILGDLCPVPKTFQKCHRNAQTLYKKITEYLYSREFRKYTLPLLVKTGEEDVWTSCLKVPRTRSRVSDYDDLALGQQSLKRKSSSDSERCDSPDVTKALLPAKRRKKIYRATSVSSINSTSSDNTSVTSSPCTSPTPSLMSFMSIETPDLSPEDSRDSLISSSSESSFIPISPPKLRKAADQCPCSNNIYSSPPRLRPQRSRGKNMKIYHSD